MAAGGALIFWVVRVRRRPPSPKEDSGAVDKMRSVASSRWIAVLAAAYAGAILAGAGW